MLRIISGKYKGRRIREASPDTTRPTTDKNREMVFNVLGQYFEGGTVLDLFAGTGALGIEALSRGMDSCWFVDKNREPYLLLCKNLADLGIALGTAARVFPDDAWVFLARHPELRADLIFLDPPYAMDVIPSLVKTFGEGKILKPGGVLVAETDRKTVLPPEIGDLVAFRDIPEGHSRFTFYRWRDSL